MRWTFDTAEFGSAVAPSGCAIAKVAELRRIAEAIAVSFIDISLLSGGEDSVRLASFWAQPKWPRLFARMIRISLAREKRAPVVDGVVTLVAPLDRAVFHDGEYDIRI
jgi:hypothetical protein